MNSDKVNDYIADFPIETQEILLKIRNIIFLEAPDATEKFSYQMPTYWQGRNLVHFAAFKYHIGLYPGQNAISHFEKELQLNNYNYAKGSIQFPLSRPIPYDFIQKIVNYSVKNLEENDNGGKISSNND